MAGQTGGVRRTVAEMLVRPAMFVLWCLVLWGTLLLGAWTVSVARLGFAETARRIEPRDAVGTVNLVLPLFAIGVWTRAVFAWRHGRRSQA